jgi:NAD(P)-dependent dehydrogenase (short-subunit alcohol dehydrogenase family)
MQKPSIVITGATRGCGWALAHFYGTLGHPVFICGRSSLSAPLPKSVIFTQADVTRSDELQVWSQFVCREIGAPDFVLNNAALINRSSPLWELSAEEIDPVLDVNLKGTIHVIRAFAPFMISAGKGIFVNFSSGWGRSTAPEVAPYCATKWAIEGLTQALAQELPPGLAAIALNPGIINTEMLQSCFSGGASAYPKPEEWVRQAGPFILSLTAKDNGRSVDVP